MKWKRALPFSRLGEFVGSGGPALSWLRCFVGVNALRAHFTESPLPRMLYERGREGLIASLTAVLAVSSLLANLFAIMWGERFSPKRLGMVCLLVGSMTPTLTAIGLVRDDPTLLRISQAITSFTGVLVLVAYGSLLRKYLDPMSSQQHQLHAAGSTAAWSIGSVMGNAGYFFVSPDDPRLTWCWAGVATLLSIGAFCTLVRVPDVRQSKTTVRVPWKEPFRLLGRSFGLVTGALVFGLTAQYASLFVADSKLSLLPMVILIICLPIGEWLSTKLQLCMMRRRQRRSSAATSAAIQREIEKRTVKVYHLAMAIVSALMMFSVSYLWLYLVSMVLISLAYGGSTAPLNKLITRSTHFQTVQSAVSKLTSSIAWGLTALIGWLAVGENSLLPREFLWPCVIPVALCGLAAVHLTKFPEKE